MNNNNEITLYDMQKQMNYKQILHCVTDHKKYLIKEIYKRHDSKYIGNVSIKDDCFQKTLLKK